MVVTTMLVWVRLRNSPLRFWQHHILEDIGNTLGKFGKMDLDRTTKGILTFAKIYVEIHLSKGLLDHIDLKHENLHWCEVLDYKNMTFRCRICYQTGKLLNTFPQEKKIPKWKNRKASKPRG